MVQVSIIYGVLLCDMISMVCFSSVSSCSSVMEWHMNVPARLFNKWKLVM